MQKDTVIVCEKKHRGLVSPDKMGENEHPSLHLTGEVTSDTGDPPPPFTPFMPFTPSRARPSNRMLDPSDARQAALHIPSIAAPSEFYGDKPEPSHYSSGSLRLSMRVHVEDDGLTLDS
ncbi:hypothetical protein AC1031_004923 [Aphanomyces cochlioides]|nr:hypothetical protein AC1031_004923 [Aphanomyces cochlioides]